MENSIVQAGERVLDFENNKVEILTLEELGLTSPELSSDNGQLNGVSHHGFIAKVLQMTAKLNLTAKVDPIYAAQNKAKMFQGVSKIPHLEEIHGQNSVRAYILRRILTRVVISDFEDDISSTAIAIAYHQNGIEVAFGPNIKVCSNQCIMGTGRFLKTYGSDRMPDYETMLEVLEDWLFQFEAKRLEDQAILKQMMEYEINYTTMSKIIGELSLMRVGKDDLKLSIDYPLSQGQINKVSRAYLEDVKAKKDNNEGDVVSLYDVYNYGTAELKPDQMEIPNVLMQNASFGNYIMDLVTKL